MVFYIIIIYSVLRVGHWKKVIHIIMWCATLKIVYNIIVPFKVQASGRGTLFFVRFFVLVLSTASNY